MLKSFAIFSVAAASSYQGKEALVHANLVTAAYCGFPKFSRSALESWKCGPACDAVPGMSDVRQIITSDSNDAYAFVGKRNGECVVVFRGTSNLNGWSQDLRSLKLVDLTAQGVDCNYKGQPCLVGDGFMANYNSISSFIKGNLTAIGCQKGESMTVSGHSLGAAEAAIAMYDLHAEGYIINQTYTFGQPRVGDGAFVSAFEGVFGKNLLYRLTHYHDPIPHLPEAKSGGFVHMSEEVYFQEVATSGYTQCDGSGEDKSCSDSDDNLIGLLLECASKGSNCDHLTYMIPVKTTTMVVSNIN